MRWKLIVVTAALLCAPFLAQALPVKAECNDSPEKCLSDISSQIAELQKQLDDARSQEKTLKSQLDAIDAQTKLTQLKIEQTNYQIAKLEKEIDDLSNNITRISGTIDSMSEVLLNRITQTYKYGNISTIDLLFSANGFSDLLQRLKYIEAAQQSDKRTLYALQATKSTYNDQKDDREKRQAQETKLKADLVKLQQQLDEQKKAKAELLRITQNNEAIYQAKIRAAQEEQAAIVGILTGGGKEVPEGPVKAGDVIGNVIIGKSACSSGTHLHFEVHQGSSLQDPNNFLGGGDWSYMPGENAESTGAINPHGPWPWPMFPHIYVSQGYGMTPYARAGAYNGGPHTGIDMYSSSSSAVKAVKDGNLSKGSIGCGGKTLYYKKIDHSDGISSFYLHML